MGSEQTFLERLAGMTDGHEGDQPSAEEDGPALMESVRRHLVRLLNARHHMSKALPDYGLPAMTDLTVGGGGYVETVRDAIRVAIQKYEPRLRRVQVTPSEEEATARHKLSFRVTAVLVRRSGELEEVWYETMLTGAGEFEVFD